MRSKLVLVTDDHVYCPLTGYCTQCGLHHEMIELEGSLCAHGDNVIAMSHLRQMQISDERYKASIAAAISE